MAGSLAEQIAALDEKINSGVASAAHKGKTVTFQSLPELRALRAQLVRRLKRQRRSQRTLITVEE